MNRNVGHPGSPGAPLALSRRQFLGRFVGVGLALSGLAGPLAACGSPSSTPGSQPAPTSPPTAPAKPTTAPAAGAPLARAANLDQIVEGAKREGQLNWIDVTIPQSDDDLFHTAFRKKYGLPDSFQIRHTNKPTGDLITQVQQEIQADKVTVDHVQIGDLDFWNGLDRVGALMDYAPSELGALDPVLRKTSLPTHPPRWTTIFASTFVPVWNKKFVAKNIKTWNDLIDPAFKDKAIQGDIRTSPTLTDTYIGLRQVLGVEFFQRYADNVNPVLIQRTAEQQQKLTSGERIISNLSQAGTALQARRQDTSLDFGAVYPPEGVVLLPTQQGILAKAPHPNAARLFSEFLISREGQQQYLDAEIRWPLRADVTYSDELRPFLPPLDQINAVQMDWGAITANARDEARAEFRRIFRVN